MEFIGFIGKITALYLGFYATRFLLDIFRASEVVAASAELLYMVVMLVVFVISMITSIKTIVRNIRLRREIRSVR